MKALRILIADDHELVREGLRARLGKHPDWVVCGEAANGRQAVKMARELKPDVVVLDISMPELNGLEASRQIRKACPQTEVLILTMQESAELVRDVLAAGARGFILKTDTVRLLVTAIDALAQHQPFFTGRVAEAVIGRLLDPAGAARDGEGEGHRLSTREREVARMLAEARTNKEVATKLGVSVKTIDAHRANIMRKLNLHSVTELVRYAIRHQLIEP
jgi:DNA-binding NarL/FixJ family response regulator